jgi:hypothetical protein
VFLIQFSYDDAMMVGCNGAAAYTLSPSWLIASHRILFILPAEHYSFYRPNTLIIFHINKNGSSDNPGPKTSYGPPRAVKPMTQMQATI